jgi:methionyl-tRNA formyltransferase
VKVLLFGYGEMGCRALEFLLGAGDDVAGAVTHRDDPAEARWYRSLAELAAARGVPVHIGEDLGRQGIVELVRREAPDLILSSYYRSMLPMEAIRLAPRGGLNIHGSLLPRLRGRAPINWALVECEERTGVTLHHMTGRADAGDIVAQRAFPIGPRDTALDLFRRTVEETGPLLEGVWPAVRAGTAPRIPQDESKATCRGRRTPEDGRIEWGLPARRIDGLVRAVTRPFPGAFTFLEGRKMMVWSGRPGSGGGRPGTVIADGLVAAGDGAYRIEECEFAGGGGAPALRPGIRLGDRK